MPVMVTSSSPRAIRRRVDDRVRPGSISEVTPNSLAAAIGDASYRHVRVALAAPPGSRAVRGVDLGDCVGMAGPRDHLAPRAGRRRLRAGTPGRLPEGAAPRPLPDRARRSGPH